MAKGTIKPAHADVEAIFDKPGVKWSIDERNCVKEWLNVPPQLSYLVRFALLNLGQAATPEDAEDVWVDFYLKRLDGVIDHYEPSKGLRFWPYLLLCFKRFCWEECEKIRRRRGVVVSISDFQIRTSDGEVIELELADDNPNNDPEQNLIRKRIMEAVNSCLGSLSQAHRQVFVRVLIEQFSYEEAAEILQCPDGTVKGRLSRAKEQMARCLREKGVML